MKKNIRLNKRKFESIVAHKKYFQALTRSIIYQQLSGKAAASIYSRFVSLFAPKKFPPPALVMSISEESLRSAGLSKGKVVYIRDLAQKFLDKTIDERKIPKMDDMEIIEHLVQVKGVGLWTAQMFLIFTLKRPDILPTGDLAIKKGFKKVFNLPRLPTEKEMHELASPYKGRLTTFSLYLWEAVDEGGGKLVRLQNWRVRIAV